MEELRTDLERTQYLQNLLIAHATGSRVDDGEYQTVRRELLANRETAALLPGFVRTCRDIAQFWGFIKYEKGSYAERRALIWSSFAPLLAHLEGRASRPSDAPISEGLKSFDADGVHAVWAKALERRESDPEGAITSARTLLETVCKHVLDEANVMYEKGRTDLPDLYKLVAKELNLAPDQHTQDVFKQIPHAEGTPGAITARCSTASSGACSPAFPTSETLPVATVPEGLGETQPKIYIKH